MKKSNFLLIPKSSNFKDIINLNDIRNHLQNKGHDCITLFAPVSDDNLIFLLSQKKIDFVFRVGGSKPEKVNKNVKFICWVKDVSEIDNLSNFTENDIIYTLKRNTQINKKLKIFQMLPAANYFKKVMTLSDYDLITDNINLYQSIDISFISNYTRRDLFSGNKQIIYETNKKNSENHRNFGKIISKLNKEYITEIYGLIDYSNILANKNIVFKGEINNFNYFFEIFRKSKFNILFENEYLDFNTNFFNIFLVEGNLIFNNKLNDQIKDFFDIEKDLMENSISFDNDSFQSKISEYYSNYKKRFKFAKKGSSFIKSKHTYKNRVDRILKDLIL